MELRIADLLFVKSKQGLMDKAIAESTGEYVHVALMLANDYVIDATPNKGVAISSLADFLSVNRFIDVYRPMISKIEKNIVVKQAKIFEGEPYNVSFYPEATGKYCSELVLASFRNIINFEQIEMKFGITAQDISDYWREYFDVLGLVTPVGQLGSNPTQLAQSTELKYVGELSRE